MATITISTDGQFEGREVHEVEDISAGSRYSRYVEGERRYTAVVHMSPEQAIAIAHDLLAQAMRQGEDPAYVDRDRMREIVEGEVW